MKYRIEISGRGGEIVLGKVNREFYDLIEENGLDIDQYAWDSEFFEENDVEIDESIRPFEPGDWYECDNITHNCGPDTDFAYMTVLDENGDIIHDALPYDSLFDLGADSELSEEIYPQQSLEEGEVYFLGQSIEKGLFLVYEVEAESFDLAKLMFITTDCDGWELITGIRYDGIDLDDLGELSTTGKGSEFQLILVEKD